MMENFAKSTINSRKNKGKCMNIFMVRIQGIWYQFHEHIIFPEIIIKINDF